MEGVAVTPTKKKKPYNYDRLKLDIAGWGFVILPVIMVGIFTFYPMVRAFHVSLQTGIGRNLTFVGFANYTRLLNDPTFIQAVRNNFTYLLVQVPVMLLLAMTYAVLLNKKDIKFRGFFRTCLFLPAITSLMAYSTVFRYLFDPRGVINVTLVNWNILQEPVGWLIQPALARATIIMAITWRWTGYNMIFYLSALQNIDEGIYEAAKIDGANALQVFFRITVPLLKPIILFTSIMSTIGTLQLFDEVFQITIGGPGNATITLSHYIYNLMFVFSPDFGYAATVSYTILVMVLVLSGIQFWVTRDRENFGRQK